MAMFCKRVVLSAANYLKVVHRFPISTFTNQVLTTLYGANTLNLSLPSSRFSSFASVADTANTSELSKTDIEEILNSEPKLQCLPIEQVKSFGQFLIKLGFPNDFVKRVLIEHSRLLEIPRDEIQQVMDIFRKMKFPEGQVFEAICEHPEILFIPPEALKKRLQEFNSYFTRGDARELLQCCPNAYFDSWSSITRKVYYIMFEIGFDQREVIVSDALRFSLEFIQLRHQTLLRCGRFTKPNPKNLLAYNGMKLKDILRCPEAKFVKFAGITIEEYKILNRILEEERENEDDTDEDSDSSY